MLPKSSAAVSEIIRVANDIARGYDLEYVGTEHMLLAIARCGRGLGARLLEDHGITSTNLADEIDRLVKKRMEETWVFGRLPGTPHFKNVMATAIEECQQLGAREVNTEHVLLALLKEQGCTACRALKNLGLSYDQARRDITAATGH